MFILINGPLGIGKSTLSEALSERIEGCVMLDGDHVAAAHPEASDPLEHLHSTLVALVRHHLSFGYRHFVINHYWASARALDDLCRRLAELDNEAAIHRLLLTLPAEENLRRIRARQQARAIDERAFENRTVAAEREALYAGDSQGLGDPFDVSDPPDKLVERLLGRLDTA